MREKMEKVADEILDQGGGEIKNLLFSKAEEFKSLMQSFLDSQPWGAQFTSVEPVEDYSSLGQPRFGVVFKTLGWEEETDSPWTGHMRQVEIDFYTSFDMVSDYKGGYIVRMECEADDYGTGGHWWIHRTNVGPFSLEEIEGNLDSMSRKLNPQKVVNAFRRWLIKRDYYEEQDFK